VLAVAIAVSGVLWYAQCNSSNAVPVYHSEVEYVAAAKQFEALTSKSFDKVDHNQALSDPEKEKLREGTVVIEAMIGYHPEIYANYYLAGKIHYALGEYNEALSRFNECVGTMKRPEDDQEYYTQTLSDAHYLASLCYFNLQKFRQAADQAQLAVQYEPKAPLYLIAESSANLQLGNEKTALALIKRALELDPKNERALQIYRLLHGK